MIDQKPVYIHSTNGMYTMKVVNHKEQLKAVINLININDLACNNITIGTVCEGSAQIITDPPGATIFIDDIRQQIGGIDITTPRIIDHIPCTDPINKPNKFKLTLPGYSDKEGILSVTSSNIPTNPYLLNRTMERVPSEAGGLLIAALAIGAFIFFLSTKEKEKNIEI